MNKIKKKHCLMLFKQGCELGLNDEYDRYRYFNIDNLYFDNGITALNAYADIPCPASQLISEETEEELQMSVNEMINNYNNPEWVNENVLPYL